MSPMKLSDAEIEKLRRSGVRLDPHGVFWHEGAPVTHPGLAAAFFRWLDRNDDGRYVLRLDDKRFVYLDVDDAPLLLRSLRWEDGTAIGVFSDKTESAIDLSTLRLQDGRAYLTAHKNLPAMIGPDAWSTLADHLEEIDGETYLIFTGDQEVRRKKIPSS